MQSQRRFFVLLLALATGCATTWQVDTYEAPGAAIESHRTFAWNGGELGTVAAVNPQLAADVDRHIREAVVAGLVRKGYQEVTDPKAAQMLVSYQVAGTRKYVTSDKPRFNAPLPDDVLRPTGPQPPAASELPPERRVTEGSVIVFVDEPAAGRLIWRGAITAETRTSSSKQGIHTAAEMAADIIESFPKASGATQPAK
ncbi:MAG: DUF4136 domain-containing protein [Steroidobacteraceae bacterium]